MTFVHKALELLPPLLLERSHPCGKVRNGAWGRAGAAPDLAGDLCSALTLLPTVGLPPEMSWVSMRNWALVSSLCASRAGAESATHNLPSGEENVSGMGDIFDCKLVTYGLLYQYRQQKVTLHTHYSW